MACDAFASSVVVADGYDARLCGTDGRSSAAGPSEDDEDGDKDLDRVPSCVADHKPSCEEVAHVLQDELVADELKFPTNFDFQLTSTKTFCFLSFSSFLLLVAAELELVHLSVVDDLVDPVLMIHSFLRSNNACRSCRRSDGH